MLIYIFAITLSLLFAFLGMQTGVYKNGKKSKIIFFSGLPLFLLAAFRYGIGTDYMEYVRTYNVYISYGERGVYEPLFYFLGRILSLLKADSQWLFVVCAAINIGFVFYSILYDSENPMLSIFLFAGMTYYFSSFNTMRQHVACAILLYSTRYVVERNPIRFLFYVLIATGFHYSSILFLGVYIFRWYKVTPRKAFLLTSLFFVCRGLVSQAGLLLLSNTKFKNYFVSTSGFSPAALLGFLVQASILFLAACYYRPDLRYNIYFGIQMIATWITLLGNQIPIISRVKWIFGLPSIILVPIVLKHIRNEKSRWLVTFVLITSFAIYSYYIVAKMGSFEVVPYRSIFFKP